MLTNTKDLHISNVECIGDEGIETEEHDIAVLDQEREGQHLARVGAQLRSLYQKMPILRTNYSNTVSGKYLETVSHTDKQDKFALD